MYLQMYLLEVKPLNVALTPRRPKEEELRSFSVSSADYVHRIHTRGVHHEHYSLFTSTNMHCVLVAQELQRHLCADGKSLSSGQP